MSLPRRPRMRSSANIRPETIAYLTGQPWPDGVPAMTKWWHSHSLWSGHVHQLWGYSVAQAAEQLGIDVEQLRAHYGIKPRYREEANGRHGG
jgi:hypothetical protein